jgi:hypothetical protein
MNYQHAFHAGNFADVHKHIVLTRILEYLRQKPAALCGRRPLRPARAASGAVESNGGTASGACSPYQGLVQPEPFRCQR